MQQLNQFRCLCVTQSFGLHFAAVLIADWLLSSTALPSATQNRRAGYRWQGLKPLCGNNLASPRQHLQGACMWLASRNLPSVCRLLTSLLYMCAFFRCFILDKGTLLWPNAAARNQYWQHGLFVLVMRAYSKSYSRDTSFEDWRVTQMQSLNMVR